MAIDTWPGQVSAILLLWLVTELWVKLGFVWLLCRPDS